MRVQREKGNVGQPRGFRRTQPRGRVDVVVIAITDLHTTDTDVSSRKTTPPFAGMLLSVCRSTSRLINGEAISPWARGYPSSPPSPVDASLRRQIGAGLGKRVIPRLELDCAARRERDARRHDPVTANLLIELVG